MPLNGYNLNFSGYWLDANTQSMPEAPGVYCVYSCIYNKLYDQVTINRLLYIGEGGNVCGRISTHEKWEDWKRLLKPGERLCFSMTHISYGRDKAEAALIFKHKPICNTEYKNIFPFDLTSVATDGDNALLDRYFSVTPYQGLPLLFR